MPTPGSRLRGYLSSEEIVPFIGAYDVFSASVASRHYPATFISGFSFAASYYGLPDIGFIAWPDVLAFAQRLRAVLPEQHILVDIDDGYGDEEVAAHVVALLERSGASGVILEDQARPRKCGHFDGKNLLKTEDYLHKLRRVLSVCDDLFVVARTDASGVQEIEERVLAYKEAGADAILVDAIPTIEEVSRLKSIVGSTPVFVNQIAGGKTESWELDLLRRAGARAVIYSTPCLFAARDAIDDALAALKDRGGRLPDDGDGTDLASCSLLLDENYAATYSPGTALMEPN